MAKLADAPDLGSGGAIHVGSTPIIRTNKMLMKEQGMMNNELQNSIFLIPCCLLNNKYYKNGYSCKRKHWFIT